MPREPLYKKAQAEMLRRINAGVWAEGDRLGNEFELADEFGVSQGTMRRALITLEGMGYLRRKPGRGTIVSTPQSVGAATGTGGLTGPSGAPLELEVFRSRHTLRAPGVEDSVVFGAGRLHEFTRTLKSEGDRFALEEVYLPEMLFPNPDEDLPADLEGILARHGLTAARIDDQLHAEETTMSDAVALSTDRHTPLLCLTRVAFDADGTALARQVLRMAGPATYGVSIGG